MINEMEEHRMKLGIITIEELALIVLELEQRIRELEKRKDD